MPEIEDKTEIPRELERLNDVCVNIQEVTETLKSKLGAITASDLNKCENSPVEPERVPLAYELYRHTERLNEVLRVLRFLVNNCQL